MRRRAKPENPESASEQENNADGTEHSHEIVQAAAAIPAAAAVMVMRNRAFRCDDELWEEAQELALKFGDNVSELLRERLREYVAHRRRR